MKIYTREGFVALPAGTLFARGKPWFFHDLCVKGETYETNQDWYYRPLIWIECAGDADQWSKLHGMLEEGKSEPIAAFEQRDGSFDDDEIFLVYERSDLDALQLVLDRAKTLLP
jgi:hypothetical protein